MKWFSLMFFLVMVHVLIAQELSLQEIMKGHDFVGYLPESPYWSAGSDTIYFRWNRDTLPGPELFQFSPGDKSPEPLTIETEKKHLGSINIYNRDFTKGLVTRDGDLFLVDISQRVNLQITNTLQRERALGFSTKEDKVIYQAGNNLFTWSLINGEIEQISDFRTGSEKKEESLEAREVWLKRDQLEFFEVIKKRVAEEEYYEKRRKEMEALRPRPIYSGKQEISTLSCSPDLRFIYYTLEDPSPSDGTKVPDYVTVSGFTTELNARPKVGVKQPRVESYFYDRQRDTVLKLDISGLPFIRKKPEFFKLYHAGPEGFVDTFENPRPVFYSQPVFSPGSSRIVLVIRSQDHKDRWIVEWDPIDNQLLTLDHQRDTAWIGGPGIGWTGGSGNMGYISEDELWFQSEKTGYSHLYVYNFKNRIKEALTEGSFEILETLLSKDRQRFFIYSNRENPFEHHFYHFDIGTRSWTKITGGPGDYQVTVSPDEKELAVLYSYSNRPTELFWMENRPGAPMTQITRSTTENFDKYPWRDPEIVFIEASDGTKVPARIYEPTGKKKNGAGIIFVHGAGYLHNVHRYWSSYFREYMFHNFLTERGYTVLDIDYRGSAGYGRDWRTAIYRHMGGKDLDDQIDGAAYLIKNKGMDAQRIGIYGGSYGGFITLMALCTRPGVFKCGAALRSVADWAHYNHGYTSNILNTPVEDSIAYYRSSPIYHAEGLEGQLLMLHGMVDTNVHFQDVIRMSQRFIELGKENWELAVFPVEDHAFIESSSWYDEYRRIWELFEKNLGKMKGK